VGRSRFFRFRTLLFAAVLAILLTYLTRGLWLPLGGRWLIRDDGPAHADIAVVLAGDQWGRRILKGADLVRAGYVPSVLVSGPVSYGTHESDLAIAFAVQHGNPAQWFIPLPGTGLSTRDEARAVLPELRRRHIRRFLLVTSDYHTARASRIFRAAARNLPDAPEFRTVAAPDEHFRAESWWRHRQSLKIVLMEWMKTVATAVGI
jgi:uncharacterized SAM-binding protein YcdF (DUF218 family)